MPKTECSHCHTVYKDGTAAADCPDSGCRGTQYTHTKPPWTHRGGKSYDMYYPKVRPYANEDDD